MVHAVTQLLSILSCDATNLHSITSPLYAHGPIASICSLHIDACTGVCNIDQAIYAGSRPNSNRVQHVSYWEEKVSCFLTFLCFLFFSFLFFYSFDYFVLFGDNIFLFYLFFYYVYISGSFSLSYFFPCIFIFLYLLFNFWYLIIYLFSLFNLS